MADPAQNQPTEMKNGEKKSPKKGVAKKIRKTPNPNQKRGQPTAAARLMSSPYIKFGWHKPLSGEVKEAIQAVSSIADSMYMLQLERNRPIESLSLRNGIFWEHRQLKNKMLVSTPSVDHLDLFPVEEEAFEDSLRKIAPKRDGLSNFAAHYLFAVIRSREFLVLPVEIEGCWTTIIARFQPKQNPSFQGSEVDYVDMEITDVAIVDALPAEVRDSRVELITARLRRILEVGCIEWPEDINCREITVPEIEEATLPPKWQTGLIAYAVSREFLRRLKVLQYRRDQQESPDSDVDREFLWAPFEEHHNFDAYRQALMAACAHQCIEGSGYTVRLALEVPSEDSNYHCENLRPLAGEANCLASDEKWDIFEEKTHTHAIHIQTGPRSPGAPSSTYSAIACALPPFNVPSPKHSPASPKSSPGTPNPNTDIDTHENAFFGPTEVPLALSSIGEQTIDALEGAAENPQSREGTPYTPTGGQSPQGEMDVDIVPTEMELEEESEQSSDSATLGASEPCSSRKRALSDDEEAPSPKRAHTDHELS
ncbi:hypothetical protein F5X98DRAFT_67972 [Xylaria grammica]|nr:hypothetical protein F5X98DRAFT_67972 [Xylaria grammica]